MPKGRYIVIEGLAANKAELIKLLEQRLADRQVPTRILTSETAAATAASPTAAELVANPSVPVNSAADAHFYETLQQPAPSEIRTLLEAGTTVIADANFLRQIAVQYYGLGLVQDYQKLHEIISAASGGLEADAVVMLDMPTSDLGRAYAHALLAGQPSTDDMAFLERVRAGYLWEAHQRKIPVIYAAPDTNTTFEQLWSHVADPASEESPSETAGLTSVAEVLASRQTPVATLAETAAAPKTTTPKRAKESKSGTKRPVSYLFLPELRQSAAVPLTEEPKARRFEARDAKGRYRYAVPETLRGKSRSLYIRSMNQFFDSYSQLLADVTQHVRTTSLTPKPKQDEAWLLATKAQARASVRPLVPLAAETAVALPAELGFVSELTHDNPKLQDQALQKLALDLLPGGFASNAAAVTLIHYQPRNELDAAAAMLYSYSDFPLQELRQAADSWPYQRKLDVLETYLQHHRSGEVPSTVLQNVRYDFDIISSYDLFLAMQQTGRTAEWQAPTPRLGYTTPPLLEEAGLGDAFDDCFDLSLKLYSALQASQHEAEAGYATLLGHKLRWKATYSLADILTLRKTEGELSHEQQLFVQQLETKLTEVHPLFVNFLGLAGSLE